MKGSGKGGCWMSEKYNPPGSRVGSEGVGFVYVVILNSRCYSKVEGRWEGGKNV